MRILDLSRSTVGISLTAALLAGCGGSQPPMRAPGTMPQTSAIATHAKSWMLPEAKQGTLIYGVGGCGGTCVLSYPKGQLVGALSGYYGYAACSDSDGDVFISTPGVVEEFAHGGTVPVASYTVPYPPAVGCSVDPNSGNLAVVGDPFVEVFSAGSTQPTSYNPFVEASFCGYDNSGDLFVSGHIDGQSGLSELPKGASSFHLLTVDQGVGEAGQVQWDGHYLTYEDVEGNRGNQKHGIISRLSISGSVAMIVGQTILNRVPNWLEQSWIYQKTIVAPYAVTGSQASNIGIWKYPKGGSPVERITKFGQYDKKKFGFTGVTISVAPPH